MIAFTSGLVEVGQVERLAQPLELSQLMQTLKVARFSETVTKAQSFRF